MLRPSHTQELNVLKPWVTTIVASAPLATAEEVAAYDNWVSSVPDAHIKEWRSQPGNYHLMTKQGEGAGLRSLWQLMHGQGACLVCLWALGGKGNTDACVLGVCRAAKTL